MRFYFDVIKLNEKYDFIITDISIGNLPKNNTILFLQEFSENNIEKLKKIKHSIMILNIEYRNFLKDIDKQNLVIFSDNPRAKFHKTLKLIFKENRRNKLRKNIKIGKEAIIDKSVVLGNNVSIGDNCIIEAGVKIKDNVQIGNNCYIGENSVIGGEGIGIDYDNGDLYNTIHIGGVVIGDNVEIGPLCNIISGRLEPSYIANNVIIGGSVYVAHDVKIEENSLINSKAMICGRVEIGKSVVIGPNSTISDNLKIKDNAVVSLGSTVVSKVKSGETVTGNFAVPHKKFLQIMKFLLLKSEE